MIGMKLNPEISDTVEPGGAGRARGWGDQPWSHRDRLMREGRRLQGETVASATFAAIGILQGWVSAKPGAKKEAPAREPKAAPAWDEIDRIAREGRCLHGDAIAGALSATTDRLRARLRAQSPEAAAQANAERAARRLRVAETQGEPSRGLFWPRLSWVAHEGARWLGIAGPGNRAGGQDEDQRAA